MRGNLPVEGGPEGRGKEPRRGVERPVEVVVVDDNDMFRQALCDLVRAVPEFVLVGEAESGEAAVEAVEALSPRMLIMDKRMPGMGGIEATRLLTARDPDLIVLLVSLEAPDSDLMRSCGAVAFLRKQELNPRALRAVWRAHGR
jgi:DNA-binding NarL/FixJ family response regulator